jgi:hypothetical protein
VALLESLLENHRLLALIELGRTSRAGMERARYEQRRNSPSALRESAFELRWLMCSASRVVNDERDTSYYIP